jgi:hypothetical protein
MKELGSSPLTSRGSDQFDETLVIVQMPGETPAGFAKRAIERIAALERAGRRFDVARLMTGAQCDPESSAARRLVTQTVASRGGMSELVLDAGIRGDDQVRAELFDLADELLAAPESIRVRVCFAPGVQ